jgi:hypothetical protein
LWIKRKNAVGDAGPINCSSFSNRTKEEAEGTVTRRRRVGDFDGQQQNDVVVVTVIKPVPPRNVVEIPLDEVAQPPQVGVLPPTIRGRRATADFLEQSMASGFARLQWYFSIVKKYLALESSAATSLMSFRPVIGVPPPHLPLHPLEAQCLRMIGLAVAPLKARPDVAIPACLTRSRSETCSSTSSELQMRRKVPQI